MNVRDLDLLTYRKKTFHWMRPDAWNPDGARLRFAGPKRAFGASTDGLGNVTYIQPVIGRPCYGIVTAFLRYKDAMRLVKGRGWLPSSRCADCILRESCERLVKQRLEAFPPLRTAHREWLLAEGPTQFNVPIFDNTHVGRLWRRVGVAAADAEFKSVNDAAVIEHYAQLNREALKTDRLRKVAKRERERRGGTIDDGHLSDFEIAANNRVMDIVDAMVARDAPRELTQLPVKSIEDMCDVWLGRAVLRASGQKCRAPDIARWIHATGRRNDCATPAALCTRVHKDLHRIARFERLKWRGTPLLEPFDPTCESWSQVWLENAALDPLHNAECKKRITPLGNRP